MLKNNRWISSTLALALSSSLLLSACGSNNDLALPSDVASLGMVNNSADADIAAALPKILAGLEQISAKLDRLELQPVSGGVRPSQPSTSPTPTSPSTPIPTRPTPGNTRPSQPTTPPPSTPAAPAVNQGQEDFLKMLNTIKNAPFVQSEIEKTEKNLQTGELKQIGLKLWTQQPNTVKIEIVKSSKSPAGTKAVYTSGVGDKLKVRPAGALSFITTDLAKTDDRIVSDNGFMLDELDFFGVVKRLSSGYSAKLIGKTTINGTAINVLKVTPNNGSNALHDQITHEHFGYDPTTHKIALWEMYNGGSEPFFRLTMKQLDFPASLPATTFKL